MILNKKQIQFIIGIGGIYCSYMYYGVIFSRKYPSSDGQSYTKFGFPWALLFLQCFFSTILAHLINRRDTNLMKVPIREQIEMGFFNAFSMLGSNTALQFMSYPLQALFKSCKVLSVLIVGLIFGKVNYPIMQYICGIIVTVGIIGFNLLEDMKSGKETKLIGIVLILFSLFSDGMLAEKQSELRKKSNPSSFQLMELTSKWCVVFSLVYALFMNQLLGFWEFCVNYPSGLFDVCVVGVLGCVGQVFIFYTIRNFGPVVLALVTTTRKFFTVLSSILLFGHNIGLGQWLCVGLVLAGVSIELYESFTKKTHHHHPHKHHEKDEKGELENKNRPSPQKRHIESTKK